MFDDTPIRIGGFLLLERSAIPDPDGPAPSIKGWQAAFEFADHTEHASPYWSADLLAYSETRAEWRAKMDQAKSRTGLAHRTLINRASIGRRVTGKARALAPTIGHAAVVAALEPEEQEELLADAKAEEWTVAELVAAKKAKARAVVLEGGAATMHTVDITVRMSVEAPNEVQAQDKGWDIIKRAIAGTPHAHVIGSCAHLPAVPKLRKRNGLKAVS